MRALLQEVRDTIMLFEMYISLLVFTLHIIYSSFLAVFVLTTGTFTTVDSIHITCTASRQTSRQTIHMEMKDMPDCIGKSCDGSYVATDEGKQDMAKLMELLFQSQGISATCTAADSATVVPRPPATTPETPHNYPQHHTTLSSANSILWNKTIMLGGFLLLATNIFS